MDFKIFAKTFEIYCDAHTRHTQTNRGRYKDAQPQLKKFRKKNSKFQTKKYKCAILCPNSGTHTLQKWTKLHEFCLSNSFASL